MKQVKFFSYILIVALMSACSCTKDKVSKSDLTETVWQLKSLNGSTDLSSFSREIPFIKFDGDSRISGNTGCNNYSGAYSNLTDEGTISFSKIITTKMYCEGVPENAFLQVLDKVDSVKKNNEELIFMDDNTPIMVFIPKK